MSSTRGKAACNGCRSRKQKCDEKKPRCTRCEDLDRTCTWPKLLKRGPVKGYVETLEHRLVEMENALLRMVLAADDSTVETAFLNDETHLTAQRQPSAAASRDFGKSEAKKIESTTHWESFPLKTAQDVRRWATEMCQKRPGSSMDNIQDSQPVEEHHQSKMTRSTENTQSCLLDYMESISNNTSARPTSRDFHSIISNNHGVEVRPILTENSPPKSNMQGEVDDPDIYTTTQAAITAQRREQQGIELPPDFSKRFIW